MRRWAGVDRRRSEAKIDLAVYLRRWVTTMQFDPVIVRLLAKHRPIQQFIERLYCVLLGDAALRRQLLHYLRRLVDLPD